MSSDTVDGVELLSIFKACLDLKFDDSVRKSLSSINRIDECLLTEMLRLHTGPQPEAVLMLVGPFMRSLKNRHELVLSSHKISFVRGCDASKLRVSFEIGNSFSIEEFDAAYLTSIVLDISTGKRINMSNNTSHKSRSLLKVSDSNILFILPHFLLMFSL